MHEHAELILTLRHVPPTEELTYYVRKSCNALARCQDGPKEWTVVVVRRNAWDGPRYAVTITCGEIQGTDPVRAEDPDVFLAVRNAFNLAAHRLSGGAAMAEAC